MANYYVSFEKSRSFYGAGKRRYFDYSKDAVIRMAKKDADDMKADEFTVYCMPKMDIVGNWMKKGTRWYKW